MTIHLFMSTIEENWVCKGSISINSGGTSSKSS